MRNLEIYGNDEYDIIKINISEEEVLEQVEKTWADEVKRIQECSEAKLQNRATGKSLPCDFEKQGCFPRLKNFPIPKYESEANKGNADPRAEDVHRVQPQMRLIWACRIRPAGLQLSPLKPAKKSWRIKEAGSVSGFSKCFWQSSS